MRIRQHTLALFLSSLSAGSLSLTGCGAEGPNAGGVEDSGTLDVDLVLGDDVRLNSISYQINGNGFTKSGTIDVSRSRTISAQIGGIPAGSGYTVTLSGNDATDQRIACQGSANFDVTARQTTTVRVPFLCHLPNDRGSVRVVGEANVCPRIDELSADPGEAAVGGAIALSAAITDSDSLPAPAFYSWSASGGELSAKSGPSVNLTCTAPGDVTVTLDVLDGECGDQTSIVVSCSPPDNEPPLATVRFNEAESQGGVPGDWAELFNIGSAPVDLAGFVFKDNDDTHVYTIPAGTSIAPGSFLVLEEAQFGFGLGGAESVRLFDTSGRLVDSHTWEGHAATTYGRCPDGTGAFQVTTSVTKGAANDCSVPVTFNEVESNGGTPGDWAELFNTGATTVNLAGYVFKDNDDTHAYVLPAGTTIVPGGYLVLEEGAFGFGLGGGDSVRLFDPSGTTVVASFTWTAHAATTYGRCPNGTGDFTTTTTSTKGAVNDCPGVVTLAPWPGAGDVRTVDVMGQFTSNLSGLTYEGAAAGSPAVLWAAMNGPGTLFRMIFDGATWTPDPANDWAAGKALRYTDGTGNPDTEGVTRAELETSFIYVATERNNDASTISRPTLLRLDLAAPGTTLTATHQWDLVADLPVVGANLGPEAITWIPDSYLVQNSFFDEAAGHAYNPAEYPDHGTGLFFIGVEANGLIYAYALNHATSGFTRIATIESGHTNMMGLEFDREVGNLWAQCDDTCANQTAILLIDTNPVSTTFGRFTVRRKLAAPVTLGNFNHEGIAIAPEAECSGGHKGFFWSDDNSTSGHSIRRDTIPCGAFF